MISIGFAVVLAVGAPAQSLPPPSPTPADIYGPLFEVVQMQKLFADGKTFVDAVPRRDPAGIMADFGRRKFDDAALKAFVVDAFALPVTATPPVIETGLPLGRHITALWSTLTRQPAAAIPGSSLIPLPRPYVVPGGRFREIYYWDSYFTMLGLVRDGRLDLVEGMIDDFTSLVERYGHVPNGTRTYYLSRSQPPFYALMVGLSAQTNAAVRARRLRAMQREHDFWMNGGATLGPGQAARRTVAMPDGSILNRYFDDRDTPRDESWREDVLAARGSDRPAADVYRDLRAGAESGWDFSSRWLGDGRTLASIRTTAIVPVDLNSLLYAAERKIAADCAAVADRACAARYTGIADHRRAAMTRYLWDASASRFGDYDFQKRQRTTVASAAMLYPLFARVATAAQARATARTVAVLVAPGGLRTTTTTTGQQWDRPNGWAPLQWVAVAGLRGYGKASLACRIATGWLTTVDREYRASGRLLEKYDVEEARPGGGGEYPTQDGFGWTNGVTQELLSLYAGPDGTWSCPAKRGLRPMN